MCGPPAISEALRRCAILDGEEPAVGTVIAARRVLAGRYFDRGREDETGRFSGVLAEIGARRRRPRPYKLHNKARATAPRDGVFAA